MSIELEIELVNGEWHRGKPIPNDLYPNDVPSVAILEETEEYGEAEYEWKWTEIRSVTVHD